MKPLLSPSVSGSSSFSLSLYSTLSLQGAELLMTAIAALQESEHHLLQRSHFGFRVRGSGFRVGFGVWGLGFGVWGLGFGVWGFGIQAPPLCNTLAQVSFRASARSCLSV